MDVHPTKNVSIGIDPYPYWNLVPNYCNSVSIETFTIFQRYWVDAMPTCGWNLINCRRKTSSKLYMSDSTTLGLCQSSDVFLRLTFKIQHWPLGLTWFNTVFSTFSPLLLHPQITVGPDDGHGHCTQVHFAYPHRARWRFTEMWWFSV